MTSTTIPTLLDARRGLQHGLLRVAIPALSLYYVFIAVAHGLVLEGSLRTTLMSLAAGTALCLGLLTPARNHPMVRANPQLVAGVVAVMVAANAIAHVVLTGEVFQTTNLVLVAVAAAAVLTSTPWFLFTLLLLGLGFGAAVVLHPGDPLWMHYGFALFGSEFLASLVFMARIRALTGRFQAERERDRVELARKEAADAALAHEGRYRTVVSLSPAAILVHRGGTVLFANRAAGRLIGVHREDELTGSPLFDLFPPADRDRVEAWSHEAKAHPEGGEALECRLRALVGQWPYVELSAAPIRWEGAPATIIVARDITARRETIRLKEELVAILGQELRSPVSDALGALDQVQPEGGGGSSENASELVDLAADKLRYLRIFLDDLLDLERAQTGDLVLDKAPVNLVSVVQDAIRGFAPVSTRAEIVVQLAPSLEEIGVTGDRGRLLQVVTNCLAHAVRVSHVGDAVRVTLTVTDEIARVEVTDDGPPMPSKERGRIFQRFGPDTSENGARGRGLGLALSRVLVQEHGGEMGVTALGDTGAMLWLTMPYDPSGRGGPPDA